MSIQPVSSTPAYRQTQASDTRAELKPESKQHSAPPPALTQDELDISEPLQHQDLGQFLQFKASQARTTGHIPSAVGSQSVGPRFLDILSLNAYALPTPLGKDLDARSTRIGQVVKDFDLVGLQETFSGKTRALFREAQQDNPELEIYTPESRRVLKSGLSILSRFEILESDFVPFRYASHADALAQKGVAFARVRLPEGQILDLYDTHFQAAQDKEQNGATALLMKLTGLIVPGFDLPRDAIRQHDAEVLADFVRQKDQGHPLFVLGDFNSKEDSEVYHYLTQDLGLRDSFREAQPEAPGYTSDGASNPYKDNPAKRKRVDYIFYRPGEKMDVQVEQSQVVFSEPVNGFVLSDHYGVHSRFKLTPKEKP